MTTRTSPKTILGPREFGDRLLETRDLDPLYVALYAAAMPARALRTWLAAYWCFYDAGTASWITSNSFPGDGTDHSPTALQAAYAIDLPRGTERRHFRGEAGRRAVLELAQRGALEDTVLWMAHGDVGGPSYLQTFTAIKKRVKQLRGFGDWIAFKVADMLDRLGEVRVAWDASDLDIYRDPAKGARMVAEHLGKPTWGVGDVVEELLSWYAGTRAPPAYDREIGVAEVETILCKWKSHVRGRYPVGHDIVEIGRALDREATRTHIGAALRQALPPEVS